MPQLDILSYLNQTLCVYVLFFYFLFDDYKYTFIYFNLQ